MYPLNQGDWLWIAHHRRHNFFKDEEGWGASRRRVQAVWETCTVHPEAAYGAPVNQLVVSWDAKVTLSTNDVQLLDAVGDANHTPLSDIWRDLKPS